MLTRLVALIRGLTRRPAIDHEVDEELAFHLEQETAAHVRRGVAPDEARRLALLALGGLAQTRDAVRDVRTTWVETVWRETHQGVRTLYGAPTFTLTAVLVLALGIGANTAVFSVLDGVLLRPLPYPQPDELVRVWSRNDERQIPFLSVSPADFEAWQQKTASLGHLAAYERPETMVLAGGAEQVTAIRATPGLFPLLGISPMLGRAFTPDDEDATAMIGFALWQRRFGGAGDVLGRPLTIDARTWTIVGVMPPDSTCPTCRPTSGSPWTRGRWPVAPHTSCACSGAGARRATAKPCAAIWTPWPPIWRASGRPRIAAGASPCCR